MKMERAHIHPTAIVHPGTPIGDGTVIGPYCVLEKNISIGSGCCLHSHVVIHENTVIGNNTSISSFAVLGGEPQHLKYKGEPTRVEIGNGVTLRESVTIHRGTSFGGGVTSVGDGSFIMAYSHIAHDCRVGQEVILANGCQLAGHVEVGNQSFLGGLTGVVQYCRVGSQCFVGGCSMLRKDLPPFMVGKGNEFKVQGINVIGLSRRGFSEAVIKQLRLLYKIFYLQQLTVPNAVEKILLKIGETSEVRTFLEFIRSSKLGFER